MKKIKLLCAYYYIGIVIGYFNKQEIIQWADSVIENEEFPHELIDVSLSANKTIEDIASLLKRVYGESRIVEPLYKIIGELVLKYEDGQITDDRFFSYLQSLLLQGNAFEMEEDLSYLLDRLDGGYYLVAKGIYGDVMTLRQEALEELRDYKKYVGVFDEV